MTRFANKTAWITGASSGIGKALALHMAENGWCIAASARSEDDLQALARDAAALKGDIISCPCDITDTASIGEALGTARAALGDIDVAILNAGTHKPILLKDFAAEDFRKLTDINLMGTVNCMEAILPDFTARGSGKICVVSSVAGFRGLPTSAGYGMTKAGLINMAEALKPELDRAGVDIQVICPGFVKTPLTDKNSFDMPFLMEVDKAVSVMFKAINSDRFQVTFPWQMGLLMKTLRIVPASLAFAVTKNFIPDEAR